MRRTFWAAAIALAAFAVALVQQPSRASADLGWCVNDPVLVINGRTVHINVAVPVEHRLLVTRSTLTVVVPANVPAQLSGINATNFPITIELVRRGTHSGDGPVRVTAEAVVYGPDGMPTRLSAWQSNVGATTESYGTAGKRMTVTFGVQ